MDRRRALRWATVAAMAAAVALAGCAYFNTLYNAKEKYDDAEKASKTREAAAEQNSLTRGGNTGSTINPQAAQYESVIEKCTNVIARYPDSRYASLQQCREEIAAAERLFERHALPVIDTTRMSVEEIAARLRLRP